MRRFIIAVFTALVLVVAGAGVSRAQGTPWNDHAVPYSFLFGNEIDTHQQSQMVGKGDLQGFFYIHFTNETIDRIPVAVHGQDTVGWLLKGTPINATLLSTNPITWCVDPGQIPKSPGFTHFHWVGPQTEADLAVGETYEGFLLKLTARTTFYFRHEENGNPVLVTPGIDYASHQNIKVGCP